MLDSILSLSTAGLTVPEFIFCTVFSILFGVVIALVHMYNNQYSKNFILTLILLPIIVQTVIMLVNGNLGVGVAVAGAFSLVRFRSVPGRLRLFSLRWQSDLRQVWGMWLSEACWCALWE